MRGGAGMDERKSLKEMIEKMTPEQFEWFKAQVQLLLSQQAG